MEKSYFFFNPGELSAFTKLCYLVLCSPLDNICREIIINWSKKKIYYWKTIVFKMKKKFNLKVSTTFKIKLLKVVYEHI